MFKLRHHRHILLTHPRRIPYKNEKHLIPHREWGHRTHSHPQERRPQGIHSSSYRKSKGTAVTRNGQRIPLSASDEERGAWKIQRHTTLWNLERKGYLIPVKTCRKVSYRQADIERIIIERGTRWWTFYSGFNDLKEYLTHQSFTSKFNDYENRQFSINS